ncbi:MAG: hypothetical protein J6M37_03290 [Prevotella sp.]|nr:hypothetical protein [Prevotella sp.]
MKKEYVSPAITVIVGYGNPLLEIGTSIIVDTGGSGASQSGAESKAANEFEEDMDDMTAADSIKYRRDPLDFIPKSFTKIWED